jgi:hypothetical protein
MTPEPDEENGGLTLRDAHSLNPELRVHVLSKKDAVEKTKKHDKYCDQLSDLLPYIFDDEVRVESVKSHGSYQGHVAVRYVFRGRHFRLSLDYGSCTGCHQWLDLDEYDAVVFGRLIPLVRQSDYDQSSEDSRDDRSASEDSEDRD